MSRLWLIENRYGDYFIFISLRNCKLREGIIVIGKNYSPAGILCEKSKISISFCRSCSSVGCCCVVWNKLGRIFSNVAIRLVASAKRAVIFGFLRDNPWLLESSKSVYAGNCEFPSREGTRHVTISCALQNRQEEIVIVGSTSILHNPSTR